MNGSLPENARLTQKPSSDGDICCRRNRGRHIDCCGRGGSGARVTSIVSHHQRDGIDAIVGEDVRGRDGSAAFDSVTLPGVDVPSLHRTTAECVSSTPGSENVPTKSSSCPSLPVRSLAVRTVGRQVCDGDLKTGCCCRPTVIDHGDIHVERTVILIHMASRNRSRPILFVDDSCFAGTAIAPIDSGRMRVEHTWIGKRRREGKLLSFQRRLIIQRSDIDR